MAFLVVNRLWSVTLSNLAMFSFNSHAFSLAIHLDILSHQSYHHNVPHLEFAAFAPTCSLSSVLLATYVTLSALTKKVVFIKKTHPHQPEKK
jgi:hypothetical protein